MFSDLCTTARKFNSTLFQVHIAYTKDDKEQKFKQAANNNRNINTQFGATFKMESKYPFSKKVKQQEYTTGGQGPGG